ncbi:invasion associated locus B family protein [Pelagibacterium flavum]|uniref:Invasion associated locus B family protein n=1 Tax=Pelagibacterium flavum TaxID=2984530 RepID=A0ABY6IPP7_9HYPH|nr:invasion associated locus B family protein [Pelagibacterium sp. YIM 151497]UYQ72374.1 invasion associated locus B family protein [Pelagibacterium sp. YIM 151497]|tara:strand:- start:1088 stop:1600 length:513 start_codon:yes stop_codon:yes gene_type:complete
MAFRFTNIVTLAALSMAACLSPALGQSVRILGEHNAWSAYATTESAGQICFVLSRPTDTEPVPAGFTGAYFYITHRPAQGIRSEINLVAGYQFAPESTATLTVGSQDFELFTEGDAAWMADPAQSANAVQAIRAGSTMSVTGTSADGQSVRQTFSLSGATAAGRSMDGAC